MRPRLALLAKGFRPFFVVAALYAGLALPLFLVALAGNTDIGSYLVPMYWHAHEMIFGFTAAVFAGFLLTAVGNWTGRPTAEGGLLALLLLLWLLGRVALLAAGHLPRLVPALLDLAFLPVLALACARPLLATRNRRNYGFVVLLGVLSLTNALFHAAALGLVAPSQQRLASFVALDVITVALVVVSGRIVPMFTRNALRDDTVRGWPALEWAAASAVALAGMMEALGAGPLLIGPALGIAGLLALLRMRHWHTARTLREPLLWILHVGCIWIGIGLLLRAAGATLPHVTAAGLHAITAGAIGSLTLGMMTRVGLGHTGRMLAVPPHITVAFICVVLGGAIRVLAPLLWPGELAPLSVAGLLWCAAFLVYLVTYVPLLFAPRVDGRPG